MQLPNVLVGLSVVFITHSNVYHCQAQFFNPLNYLDQLPSLKMPYVNNVPIPNIPLAHVIKPTPAITTKVINVVTKYVARNPVCIKSSGKKKPPCKKEPASTSSSTKNYANDHIVTKEYFVNYRMGKQSKAQKEEEQIKKLKTQIDTYTKLKSIGTQSESAKKNETLNSSSTSSTIYGSESTIDHSIAETKYHRVARDIKSIYDNDDDDVFDGEDDENEDGGFPDDGNTKVTQATPELHARKLITGNAGGMKAEKMKDLLIEDRLDRLEDMLPHYTRMRVYQTSTITVTRTRMARMATATLMVKNCVPDGIDYCTKQKAAPVSSGGKKKKQKRKTNKRRSKVAIEQTPTIPNYNPYYYG